MIGRLWRGWRGLPLGIRAVGLLGMGLLALAGVELAARRAATAPLLPGWRREAGPQGSLMEGHPTRLWGMTPGIQPNAGAYASINDLGLRGPLPEQPRPPGRERILLLGDSSFFGHGVEDDEALPAQLQARLRARGLDVEVVNGAVAGYSLAQSRVLMEEVGWDLQPTLVLYASVWSDNTWDAFPDEALLRSRRAARHNPLVHSAAVRLLIERLALAEGRLVVFRPEEGWPAERVRRVPLDRYKALLDGLIREGASRGAGSALILPTNTTLLDPGSLPAHMGWTPYFQAISALGACHGLPVVDLTPPFRAAAAADGLAEGDLFLDRMHPTPRGQALTAEAIDAALQAAGWPEARLLGQGSACDLDSIQDIPVPAWFSSTGESPQSFLFPPASQAAPPPPSTPARPPPSVGHF